MPRWLPWVLARIRELATRRKIRFTHKALHELAALEAELDEDDVCDVLASLERRQSAGRVASEVIGEWLYVFKPVRSGMRLYVKLILRSDCVLISFHEDTDDDSS